MMTDDPTTLSREVKIAASPDVVFAYLTEPEKMRLWQAAEVTSDLRPGGAYRLDITGNDIAIGEYVEVVPPTRLVYTWGWQGNDGVPPGSSTVEITLEADGDYTILRMIHRGLPTAESAAQHTEGWDHYLARLALAATGADPGADPWRHG